MHITVELILQYATLGTLITGVVSLIVSTKRHRREVNSKIFIEIASRYVNMLRSSPAEVWAARFNNDQSLPPSTHELTLYVLEYVSTVVFAYVLHEQRYLASDLWKIFQAEHERTLASALFYREWKLLKFEFEMYPNFIAYVDSLQLNRHKQPH